MYNNNWYDGSVESNSSFLGANQLILNNQLQHPRTQYKEQKHKIQLISELANNENTDWLLHLEKRT